MFGFLLEVVKRSETSRFVVLPKRWIIERTFAGLAWHRRLSEDYEHSPKSSEAMVYIASSSIMLRKYTLCEQFLRRSIRMNWLRSIEQPWMVA